ncbi:MAG: peptide deformylase [Fibromonadaceae bacterium]|jgi:peptide deformylase|nr:peptide deformylase [Fibromonadaceae bacterium]
MILPISTYGSPILRKKAEPVEEITPELLELANNMLETMYKANGVGLAAPQVGKSIRLVVIDLAKEDEEHRPIILFNPEVVPEEGENPVETYEEGCLSVPDVWANVSRPSRVRLTYTNEKGERVVLQNITGKFARCAQHEQDHLNGILFTDKISVADKAMNASKLKKMAKENK